MLYETNSLKISRHFNMINVKLIYVIESKVNYFCKTQVQNKRLQILKKECGALS